MTGTQPSAGQPDGLSENALVFFNHWQSLRDGDALPTSQSFLDNAQPALQPLISLNDVDDQGNNMVVLFGTELVDLWQSDLTGKNVSEFITPEQAHRLTTDLVICAQTPCGIWEVSTLKTTTGRRIAWEMVTLPIGLGDPNRFRIARYHNILEPTKKGELVADILHFQQKEWFDIGSGIPQTMPLMRSS